MATKSMELNGVGSFDSTENRESKPEVNKKPPQDEDKCDCCGKLISELKPLDRREESSGDLPWLFNESGPEEIFLIRLYRGFAIKRNYKWDKILDKYYYGCNSYAEKEIADEIMIKRYGYNKYNSIMIYQQMLSDRITTWECRDCCQLFDIEFWNKNSSRHSWPKKKFSSLVKEKVEPMVCGISYFFWVLSGKKFSTGAKRPINAQKGGLKSG